MNLNNLHTMKQRIDYAKKQLKATYKDLGDLLGMSEAAFGMAIKRESLSDLQIREIENKLGIVSGWLKTGEGEMITSSVNEPAGVYNKYA
jgi:cyanate lyase